jgi:hypothetical protein
MKPVKIILIAALTVISVAALAQGVEFKANPVKKVLNVSITEAVKIPGLVPEMYKQLDAQFLLNNQLVYTKYVLLKNTYYRISGTWEQWDLFFNPRKDVKENKVEAGAGNQ